MTEDTQTGLARVGRPVWPSLQSADPQRAREFYTAVLGLSFDESATDIGTTKDGRPAAGVGEAREGGPAGWTLCFGVSDVDDAIRQAVSNGGAVLVNPATPPVDCVLQDSSGTAFGVCRVTEEVAGFAVGTAGSLLWGELITDDVESSSVFYGALFGWSPSDPEGPVGRRTWQLDDHTVSLLLPRPAAMAKDIPAYWDLYFQVADLSVAATTATDAGGRQLMAPTPIGLGDISVFLDPAGAVFTLIQPSV